MPDLVLLAGPGASSWAVANALRQRFGDVSVVFEDKLPTSRLLRARVRRLGWASVLGQVLFQALWVPRLRRQARGRVREILAREGFDLEEKGPVRRVPSVNDAATHRLLQELQPRVVVVNGTRILTPTTLTSVPCRFLNMHMGITPAYRGAHGGYWALAEGRPELVGTTVHVVDPGIDTGTILAQRFFAPTGGDNFTSYPWLHLAAGLPALLECVERELEGKTAPAVEPPETRSALHHHPTLWGYLARGVP